MGIEIGLGTACIVVYWFVLFYWGRGLDYFLKGIGLYLVGLTIWFGSLALGASLELPSTSKDMGVIGLFLVPYFVSSLGGGHLYEKWRLQREFRKVVVKTLKETGSLEP